MNLDDYQPRRVALVDFVPRGRIPLDRLVLPDGVIDAWAGEEDGEPVLGGPKPARGPSGEVRR